MRIALFYAPPWKIAAPGAAGYPPGQGAPAGIDPDALLSGDFLQAPYGLLSLAAQALRSGMAVAVFNLSNFPWPEIETLVGRLEADLFGLSCLTVNRRGTALLAGLIRQAHPAAHIVVGGPHVTALPLETLAHVPAIDTVVIGEGEETFLEMLDRLRRQEPVAGLAGTAWRGPGGPQRGAARAPMADIDRLASPLSRFDLRTLVTSRGCPMACTFCSSRLMWGRQVRYHSVDYVLDMLATAVKGHGRRTLAIKDDTFTAHRRRALAICRQIRRRRLDFIWSCDTRADYLDAELLRAMRLAGCTRISLGVESASETILKNIKKGITPAQVLERTREAQDLGLEVRYYMMVGNRGETAATFRQSLDFIERARPDQFVFSQLHLYPGTEEFDIFRRCGAVSADCFFKKDFLCLTCFAGSPAHERAIRRQLASMAGVQQGRRRSVDDGLAVLARLPDNPLAHADLCRAYLRQQAPDEAAAHLRCAVNSGYCLPGMVDNLSACIAAQRGDTDTARDHLERALRFFPHPVVVDNHQRLDAWLAAGGPSDGCRLELAPGQAFEPSWSWHQPEDPAPVESEPLYRPRPSRGPGAGFSSGGIS